MQKVILVRHGESEFNVRGALNGDVKIGCGLTAIGLEQARRLREALRDEPLDLCVTSEFERAQATADEVVRGRDVPRLVLAELNDPLYGPFEGGQLEDYRAWASAASSRDAPGPDGESRYSIIDRYARAFRIVLGCPEEAILVISHSLPVAYALGARDGLVPQARVRLAGNATPYRFTAGELERAAELLERWLAAPSW
jgi:broad specificity phosphatase PhoE